MTIDWTSLDEELARWQSARLSLPVWCRDDDATHPTPALERLISLSDQFQVPCHLAVIPQTASHALAKRIAQTPLITPVQHGWGHHSHAPEGQKKAEFGAHRPLAEMRRDLTQGQAIMADLFGSTRAAMFVPPWNRISPELPGLLAELGFTQLSTFLPRKAVEAAPGLIQINTHFDPVDWHKGRSLRPVNGLIAELATLLRDRREGKADNREPLGILTHHLMQDEAIWSFLAALFQKLTSGPSRQIVTFPQEISA